MGTAWTVQTILSSVLTVVTLFFLGLISPGPNFFIVVQSTLRWGRLAGFLTGLGAATGDALYATCGLFGVSELIERSGHLMIAIKVLGGLYLVWIGGQMLFRRSPAANPSRDFIAHFFVAQKFDVFFPRQRDEHADAGGQTFFQKPIRRRMIDTHHVHADLAPMALEFHVHRGLAHAHVDEPHAIEEIGQRGMQDADARLDPGHQSWGLWPGGDATDDYLVDPVAQP